MDRESTLPYEGRVPLGVHFSEDLRTMEEAGEGTTASNSGGTTGGGGNDEDVNTDWDG